MNAARVRVAALCVAWLATGCNPVAQTAAYTSPSLSKQGLDAIASLISETGAASADEAEVRDLLRRSSAVAFPARVGILFFNYTPPLPEDERQRLLARLGEEVVASGLARGAVAVPDELGR
ncbi:MAG: hypothetical protein VKQ33_09890, partial [Candidatus Sericytochromatia bacterium]|nr:hypothetical protein [Candidatus Sericytochromatia bacterium]